MQRNPIGWVEIPVKEMDRAITFYETVLDCKIEKNKFSDELTLGLFPMDPKKPGSMCALAYSPAFYEPKDNGTLIYFTATSGDVANEESRVEQAGGKVLMPKKQISEEHGYMSVILDSEGNRVALHSRNG